MNLFTETLAEMSAASGLPMSQGCLDKMSVYYTMLEEANRSFNLTSIQGPADSAMRHFMDSLALPALNRLDPGNTVIDVGTGAGFPGIPLAIYRESLLVTLLDSTRKKTAFLGSVIQELGLTNVSIITARAEDHARSAGRERFDAAISRAVAPLNVLLEYMLPFVKPGGRVLAWKGPSAANESAEAVSASRCLGGSSPVLHSYSIAGRDTFFIVEVNKLRLTPSTFPRKAGKPSSCPLK